MVFLSVYFSLTDALWSRWVSLPVFEFVLGHQLREGQQQAGLAPAAGREYLAHLIRAFPVAHIDTLANIARFQHPGRVIPGVDGCFRRGNALGNKKRDIFQQFQVIFFPGVAVELQ